MAVRESPRIRRLRKDHERLTSLVDNSNLIRVEEAKGNPPETYVIRFTCKGIASIESDGTVAFSENHVVRIELHKEYPVKAPYINWITPIFHPNFNNSRVCFNAQLWSPEQRLDDLVIMLGRMIQFQHFNVDSPLDKSAAIWAKGHKSILPVDNRPLHHGLKDKVESRSPVIKIQVR